VLEIGLLLGGRSGDSATERQRATVAEAVLAESLGFDSVWIDDDALAAPQILLAAIAARTERVRVGAAIPIARFDPVRVAEDFATLDAISNGRVALLATCDAAADRDGARFREKVALLHRLWSESNVTWSGRFRAPLDGVTIEPRPVQTAPPIWIGDLSPASAHLAAELGLPLLLPSAPEPPRAQPIERYRSRPADPGHAALVLFDAAGLPPEEAARALALPRSKQPTPSPP
jgi:alkanesulfonate monooxygenase SsuD/methylene tetrahydromethanopterin reductase-like flavin-dependent oxidoreductase (luciferase family)